MNIILDTNIIISDPKFKSPLIDILIDYLEKTDSTIYIPQIVLEEVIAVYKRYTNSLKDKIIINKDRIEKYLYENVNIVFPNIDKSCEKLVNNLRKRFKIVNEHQIVNYKNEYFKEVINRAINHIRPCSDNKEELRDTIIWLTLLDIAKESTEKIICFISDNVKDFAGKKNELHRDLIEDMEKNDVKIIYYKSIDDFVKEHVPKITEFSIDKFKTFIDINDINKQIERYLDNHNKEIFYEIEREGYITTDYLCFTNIDFELSYITVYEMKETDCFFIQATFYSEVEVEAEVEKEWDSIFDDDFDHGLKLKLFYIELQAVFNIVVKNKEIIQCEINFVEPA